MRNLLLALVVFALAAVPAAAQIATGSVYGSVTDESGAALPGVAITLKGADATKTTTSDAEGRFRFLNLAPGTYELTSALAGFSTMKRENVVVAVGAAADIPVPMKVATIEETILVTAESPVIDTKKTGTSTTFSQDELAKIPNSRDPWALLRTVPGVVMDRVNVAGNESGQQSSFRAKGALGADSVWNLDGVNITDMAAIGASPTYFDYDAFQEIQISTSGNDIRQPTGGVGINFVTKRGTNEIHGTVRSYFTHEDLGWSNVPDELANPAPNYIAAGVRPVTAETANHNKQISDYGFDIGGPILKDRLWFWGSYGKQDIRLVRATPTTQPLIDKTLLKDYNLKVNWQASKSDMVSLLWFNGAKLKFNRAPGNCAGCNEPASATWNQGNAAPEGFPEGLWKIEDNHIFNPSLYMTAKYAYYGTGFQLFPVGGLEGQLGISPLTGQTYGTAQLSKNVRPQHIANLDANWFASGLGGGHEFKFGAGYRWTEALTQTLYPGDQVVGYENSATDFRARVNREGLGINQAYYYSAYVGDTFTRNRLTVNLGMRYDRQTGKAVAADVQGNGAFPALVPGISFEGYDAPFTFSDFSPRVGVTLALDDARKTLLRASYGRYVTQLATGEVGFMNPSGGQGWAEYRWTDSNGDHFAQPGEVNTSQFLASGGGFNPANPTAVSSANRIDPDLQAPRTNEIVAGIDRELFPNFAVSLSYTYRKLNRFYHQPRIGMTPADYTAQAPITGALPDGTPFSLVTYIPNPALVAAGNSGRNLTNADGYHQRYSGFEISAVKRLSNKWMFRFAGSYNDHTEHWEGTPFVIDEDRNTVAAGNPTGLDVDPAQEGGQVAARAAGSGTGDVFINAKWAVNANAMYQLPWGMEIAGNLFGKQGTPFPIFRNTPLGLDGSQRVLVSPSMDDERYSDLWNLDLRLAKNFTFGRAGAVVTADLFNVLNSNTELLRQRSVTSNQFGLLTDNLSPRILRLGVRLSY